ncbi:amidase [Pendulispora albinea]|uniref:Amidase n=1 Tax=Pendulispora albinea TaxID=2741071 RepID=A0ABZ2LQJ5_9BACT
MRSIHRLAHFQVAATAAAVVLAAAFQSSPARADGGAGLDSLQDAEREPAPLSFDLDKATIPDLARMMGRGELSSIRLTLAYLQRIHHLDGKLGSVLFINPLVLAEAAASDVRHRAGKPLGPMDGIPVLLKDNADTVVMPTTAGSRALLGSSPARDAFLVRRLRAGGAVILGKANLSEWANFRSVKPTSGWSGVGGHTNNPHVLDRNPCGSSSGSGAAVAASLAQVAIGSETDGSIVCAAGMNGVVGHKPSLGLVSRSGVVPISAEQDTAGPITRHVVDSAIALSVLQARDPDDPATGDYPRDQPTNYAKLLDPNALRGARIGLWSLPVLGPDVDRVMRATADTLRANGATVIEVVPPYQDQLAADELPALLTEFKRDINAYLATRIGGPRTLADLIAYNRRDPAERTCFADQGLFEQAEVAPPPSDPGYRARRARLADLSRRSIDETLAKFHLDAIVAPTNPPAWKTDCVKGDNDIIPSSTPAAIAGYPHTTVPAGFIGPLPVGISIFAGRWSDARVLSLASAVERVTAARRPPRFLPTL